MRGQVFARKYQLIELLGEGSIGASYLAEHVILRKRVTVKLFRRTFINNENAYDHLMAEASAAANISHPYLVSLFDFGISENGIPFAVMEFVDGTDIKTAIDTEGPMKPARVVRLARLICDALGHAHENGVIHRDLNPTNILLFYGADGVEMIKIVDFGIAKAGASGELEILEQQGEVLGNPAYTSPEQATGGSIDIRSDIYSFGCVLFEMLTGKPPFPGQTAQEMLNSQVMQKPKKITDIRPELKSYPELEGMIDRCLSKDPENRYESMFQLRDEIGLLSTKLDKKKRGKGNLNFILGAVGAVLLLIITGTAMFFAGKAMGGGGTESGAPARPAAVGGESSKGPSIAVAEIGRLLGRAKSLENASNAEGAIRSYENALKLCSDSAVPLDLKLSVAYPLMVLYRKQGMEKPATRLYSDIQSLVSSAADRSTEGVDATLGAEVVYQFGLLQTALGDEQSAPDDAKKHYVEGQKALKLVANVLEKSETDSPLLAEIYQRLGGLYLKTADNALALAVLEKALTAQASDKKPVQGKTKALLAKAYNALGEYQKATVEAQMAIELLGNSDVKLTGEMEAMRKQIAAMPPKPAADTTGSDASGAASVADGSDEKGAGSGDAKSAGSGDAKAAGSGDAKDPTKGDAKGAANGDAKGADKSAKGTGGSDAKGADKSAKDAEKPAKDGAKNSADKSESGDTTKSKSSDGDKSKSSGDSKSKAQSDDGW